jgi:hypothetical protein
MNVPCSICGDKPRGKAASVYWRWQSSPDDWVRYRQRFCATCFQVCVLPIYMQARAQLSWGVCTVDDEREHDGDVTMCWATMYTPKATDPINFELGWCEAHVERASSALRRGAEDLNAREGSGRGRPLPDPWEAVELPSD